MTSTDATHITIVSKMTPDHLLDAPLLPEIWPLEVGLDFLNHGSYGVCPTPILQAQSDHRRTMESEPVRWFLGRAEKLLDGARDSVAELIGCQPRDLGWTPNATIALTTVLFSLGLKPGDEVLVNDHEYMSVINELQRMHARGGPTTVVAPVPFPITSDEDVIAPMLERVTPNTRLAVISHITSPTATILPVARLIRELQARGVMVLLDGAHSPGQIGFDLEELNPDFFAADLHKWVCTPKGTGLLWVRPDHQARIRPLALSSRAHNERPDRSRFLRDFDYMGTDDHTPMIVAREAIELFAGAIEPGASIRDGWRALMKRNHDLVLAGRRLVCDAIGVEPGLPERFVPTMAAIRLPAIPEKLRGVQPTFDDPLQDRLVLEHNIQVPIWVNMLNNQRYMRISAQLYNHRAQYRRLADALRAELAREAAM